MSLTLIAQGRKVVNQKTRPEKASAISQLLDLAVFVITQRLVQLLEIPPSGIECCLRMINASIVDNGFGALACIFPDIFNVLSTCVTGLLYQYTYVKVQETYQACTIWWCQNRGQRPDVNVTPGIIVL